MPVVSVLILAFRWDELDDYNAVLPQMPLLHHYFSWKQQSFVSTLSCIINSSAVTLWNKPVQFVSTDLHQSFTPCTHKAACPSLLNAVLIQLLALMVSRLWVLFLKKMRADCSYTASRNQIISSGIVSGDSTGMHRVPRRSLPVICSSQARPPPAILSGTLTMPAAYSHTPAENISSDITYVNPDPHTHPAQKKQLCGEE